MVAIPIRVSAQVSLIVVKSGDVGRRLPRESDLHNGAGSSTEQMKNPPSMIVELSRGHKAAGCRSHVFCSVASGKKLRGRIDRYFVLC